MPALAALVGGMAQGRLQEHAAQDKMKIDEAKIAAKAKAERQRTKEKRLFEVNTVVEEISARNPEMTKGDQRKLTMNLMSMPNSAFNNISNQVFSTDPDKQYRFINGRIMTKKKPPDIGMVGDDDKLYSDFLLGGGSEQFNEALKSQGVDLEDITDAATPEQLQLLKHHLGSKIQQQRARGIQPLDAAISLAPELKRITSLESGWWSDTLKIRSDITTGVPRPQSVQVNRGGGTRDWSTNNLYSWGGRMWRWLGGPEGPNQNPEGNNPNNWEPAS